MPLYELADGTILMLDKISMITFNKFECIICLLGVDGHISIPISEGQELVEYLKNL